MIDNLGDLLPPVDPHDVVNPRNLGEEVLSIALGKATPNDNGADLSRFFPGELFPDNAQGFLASGLNESTGVYQHDIGVGGIRGDGPAVSDQVAKHLLGVDKVFGAAEANQGASFCCHTTGIPGSPNVSGEVLPLR